jgi:hypothetical protein
MAFMQHQVTERQQWLQVETRQGTVYLPCNELGLHFADATGEDDAVLDAHIATVQQYCEGSVISWSTITGYGARTSAPGYLDCTEWAVYPTAAQAQAYLDEYYPEDDDSDSDSD